MIEIVTLFLGLVNGPQAIELAVRAPATAVEVRLDGELAGRLTAPPWRLEIDLGEALAPHAVVAIAYDRSGRELARARCWINIDMPLAEIGGRAPRLVGLKPGARNVPEPFKEALADLRRTLKRQRIVWLEGRHLPQDIELSPAARGIRLAGRRVTNAAR